jgi:hypothetical protein
MLQKEPCLCHVKCFPHRYPKLKLGRGLFDSTTHLPSQRGGLFRTLRPLPSHVSSCIAARLRSCGTPQNLELQWGSWVRVSEPVSSHNTLASLAQRGLRGNNRLICQVC